jgi:hypothetical protein
MGEDLTHGKCRGRRRSKKMPPRGRAIRLVADMLKGRIFRNIDRRREKANMRKLRRDSWTRRAKEGAR